MARRTRAHVQEADVVYRERIGDRHQAGVRCPRCSRVIAVEWDSADDIDIDGRTRSRSLGRCESCYRSGRARAGGRQPSGIRGYVHVILEPDGALACGAWAGDVNARLEMLVTGVSSCGCCHVTLVRCGGCGIPVAARHKSPEVHRREEVCGYCPRCDRIISITAFDPEHPDVLRFSDRVASPAEIGAARRYEWQDRTRGEMHEVDGWTTMRKEIPRELLDLVDLPDDAVEFIGRDGRLTWEAWLDGLGDAEGRAHDGDGPGGG